MVSSGIFSSLDTGGEESWLKVYKLRYTEETGGEGVEEGSHLLVLNDN